MKKIPFKLFYFFCLLTGLLAGGILSFYFVSNKSQTITLPKLTFEYGTAKQQIQNELLNHIEPQLKPDTSTLDSKIGTFTVLYQSGRDTLALPVEIVDRGFG